MLRAAATLFRRQGYAATGWRQVVAESEAPWGSQHHHFPGGKEQLATEALGRAGDAYGRMLQAVLAEGDLARAVETWARVAAQELERSGWADGCPIATVALETAHTSDALAEACGAALSGWRQALATAFADAGLPQAEAASLATLVLAAIEGGLLLARATRSRQPLHQVGKELASTIRARVP